MEYNVFLKRKQIQTTPTGFDVNIEDLNNNAFDWQKHIVKWALKKGKAALFEDCGLGKTLQQLMWANQVHKKTNKPVLILAPLAVSLQTRQEGLKFGVDVNICESQSDAINGINITNYEKLEKFDPDEFVGVVLDESSILKSYMGKTKRLICDFFKDVPYRLACTATPAPNDLMELLNHAEFLGVMRSNEALAVWFIADQRKSGKYRLKGHAERDFWNWVSSWAVCISSPSDIGYSDDGYILPPLKEYDLTVKVRNEYVFGTEIEELNMSATGYMKERRRTLEDRCLKTAELVNNSDEQFVVWCGLNEESNELKKLIRDAVEVKGGDKTEKKEQSAFNFINGKFKVLISKPSIFGYGLNFQNCHNSVFCGLDYSFENYYQAVRRLYRFGQRNEVNVFRVLGENEKVILDTVKAKAKLKENMGVSMAKAMKEFQIQKGTAFKLDLSEQKFIMPSWI